VRGGSSNCNNIDKPTGEKTGEKKGEKREGSSTYRRDALGYLRWNRRPLRQISHCVSHLLKI